MQVQKLFSLQIWQKYPRSISIPLNQLARIAWVKDYSHVRDIIFPVGRASVCKETKCLSLCSKNLHISYKGLKPDVIGNDVTKEQLRFDMM